jgi:hypothetical protein
MRVLHQLALAAGALCAPSLAMAQYYSYGAPATLPAPTSQVRPMSYASAAYPHADVRTGEVIESPTAVPSYHGNMPAYDSALSGDAGCSTCNGGDSGMGDCGCGMNVCDCCPPCWFGSLAALYMERNRPNPYQLSFDTTNPVGELILNIDTVGDWEAGFEARVGRYIGCNSAVEVGYWTLDNFGGQVFAFDPAGVGGLNTPIDFRSLNFGGTPVTDWFDNAQAHRFTRNDEIHNVEINFLRWSANCDPCARLQTSGLVGVRYFQFREGWELASSDNDPTFGVDPTGEAYYNINVDNDMLGVQIGGRASYCITQRLSAYAAPRVGVFWNNISHRSSITSGDGQTALDISSDRDVWSLLAQLDVGGNLQVTPNIGLWAGYRVVAISGIALADDQVPYLADDLFGISDIDHNANLVLHGVMGGVTVTY